MQLEQRFRHFMWGCPTLRWPRITIASCTLVVAVFLQIVMLPLLRSVCLPPPNWPAPPERQRSLYAAPPFPEACPLWLAPQSSLRAWDVGVAGLHHGPGHDRAHQAIALQQHGSMKVHA